MSSNINKNLKLPNNTLTLSLDLLNSLFNTPTETISDCNILRAGIFYYKGKNFGGNNAPSLSSGKMISISGGESKEYYHQFCIPDYDINLYHRYRFYYQSLWRWSDWVAINQVKIS